MSGHLPAYPTADGYKGISARDYFAAKALSAFGKIRVNIEERSQFDGVYQEIARNAYIMADAMLEERSKENEL